MRGPVMDKGFHGMVVAVLLVSSVERTRPMLDSCAECPAGTFCAKNKDQSCLPCPRDSYSSMGGRTTCNICRKCEGPFRTKKPCSSTSNAECECAPGYHCSGPGCTRCHPHCERGQEFTEEGCKDCRSGTFNDKKGDICRPWTQCSLNGKTVLVNGTKESDAVCGPIPGDFSPGISPQFFTVFLVLLSAMVVFLVICLCQCCVANGSGKKFVYLFKQPFMKPVQTAQMEDACSYRFPQEEEGECEL